MIPNDILREAAARTYEGFVSGLLSDYDAEYRYEFSSEFEKKIMRLKRRADHPIFYQALRRVAVILLAFLFAGAVWIAVDSDARAAFFGWIGEISGSYFEYHHEGITDDAAEPMDYRPSWIPDGYSEKSISVFEDKTTVRYENEKGELLRFSYVNSHENVDWSFDVSKGNTKSSSVGHCMASLFISELDSVANGLTWVNDDDIAFCVTGFISETELIKMAESVHISKK